MLLKKINNMQLKNYFIYIILVLSIYSTSCNRYIDAVAEKDKLPKTVGYLTVYPDSNLFSYKSNVALTRDIEKIYPKSFKITLPKDLKYYEVVGSTEFVFYYANNQAVMVKVDLDRKSSAIKNYLSYVPNDQEIEQIVQSKLASAQSKYDIKKIRIAAKNKQYVVKEKGVLLLLYNIQPKNHDIFVKSLKSFDWQP